MVVSFAFIINGANLQISVNTCIDCFVSLARHCPLRCVHLVEGWGASWRGGGAGSRAVRPEFGHRCLQGVLVLAPRDVIRHGSPGLHELREGIVLDAAVVLLAPVVEVHPHLKGRRHKRKGSS
jgi:hypothetical protein